MLFDFFIVIKYSLKLLLLLVIIIKVFILIEIQIWAKEIRIIRRYRY